MKKDYYYIVILKDGKSYGVELIRGYIDEYGLYGYRYVKKPKKSRWECIDLKSGLLVIAKKTIDECVKFVIENENNLNKIRETSAYKHNVALFNRTVKAQQMKDDAEFNAGW